MDERGGRLSSLKFVNYVVNKVEYTLNNTNSKEEGWTLNFDIVNETKINQEKNKMSVTLKVNIFEGVKDAPFYLTIQITGYFELNGEDDISEYQANAIAIMYPYLRAIVSNYTASANVMPVILPAINVNAMLKNRND